MRKPVTAVIVAATAVIAGCGSSDSSSVGTGTTGADRLRSIFDQAMADHTTVTETFAEGSGPNPNAGGQTCTIQLHPTKAADCVTPTPGGPFHTVATTDGLFISTPDAAHTGDKPWRKVDLHGSDPLAQIGGIYRTNHGIFAPDTASVTGSSPDRVNGTPCTRYDLTFDTTKLVNGMLEQTGSDALEATGRGMSKVGGIATGKVWIATGNLPAQTVVQLSLENQPTRSQTVTYTDWDKPVHVQAPPTDQVGGGN